MSRAKTMSSQEILERIRQSSEFPTMANTIMCINQFNSAEDASVDALANIILKDYALTSKVLHLVNGVQFSQYNEVTTVSRAIILMGFENIKNLALSLMLFDQLQKHPANQLLMNTVGGSIYSGVLSQKIAKDVGKVDTEEALISGLFHLFGKIMVAFYLTEKMGVIHDLCEGSKMSEREAAMTVLGLSFETIGIAIAKEWNFPKKIVRGMEHMRQSEMREGMDEIDTLRGIATLSNQVSQILASDLGLEEKGEAINGLIDAFSGPLGIAKGRMVACIEDAKRELVDYYRVFDVDVCQCSFMKQLSAWSGRCGLRAAGFHDNGNAVTTMDSMLMNDQEETPETLLAKGVQDINSAIINNYTLNDIIKIVLETMYRSIGPLGIANVLFLLKSPARAMMEARFGFGEELTHLREWFKVPLGPPTDVFNRAISQSTDIVVRDSEATEIAVLLPEWYRRKATKPRFFILMPIILNKKPLGLFYLDGSRSDYVNVSTGHLKYLKILRDQTVLAIRQKQEG